MSLSSPEKTRILGCKTSADAALESTGVNPGPDQKEEAIRLIVDAVIVGAAAVPTTTVAAIALIPTSGTKIAKSTMTIDPPSLPAILKAISDGAVKALAADAAGA